MCGDEPAASDGTTRESPHLHATQPRDDDDDDDSDGAQQRVRGRRLWCGGGGGAVAAAATCDVCVVGVEQLVSEDGGCVVVHLIAQTRPVQHRIRHLPCQALILHTAKHSTAQQQRTTADTPPQHLARTDALDGPCDSGCGCGCAARTWKWMRKVFACCWTTGSELCWRATKAERKLCTPPSTLSGEEAEGGGAAEEEGKDIAEASTCHCHCRLTL